MTIFPAAVDLKWFTADAVKSPSVCACPHSLRRASPVYNAMANVLPITTLFGVKVPCTKAKLNKCGPMGFVYFTFVSGWWTFILKL